MERAEVAPHRLPVDTILKHYRQEKELYQTMLEIAQLRQDMLRSECDTEYILLLSKQTEEAMECIDQLEVALAPLKAQWNLERPSSPELDALLESIVELVHRIMETEQQNEDLLCHRRDGLETSLVEVEHRLKAHAGYGSPRIAPPRFVDVQV